MNTFKSWLLAPIAIANALWQIYGELNRIRLIMGSKSTRGQEIEEFDKTNNGYIPFFDNSENWRSFNKKGKK